MLLSMVCISGCVKGTAPFFWKPSSGMVCVPVQHVVDWHAVRWVALLDGWVPVPSASQELTLSGQVGFGP